MNREGHKNPGYPSNADAAEKAHIGSMSMCARSMTPEEELRHRIERDFSYHRPQPLMTPAFRMLRTQCKALANMLVDFVPPGRELDKALSSLEDVMMNANAGIARQGPIDNG